MKNWLYTTLLMLALSLSAQAQLQKGDWMLDFGAGLSINHKTSTFSHTNYNSSFTPQAGYMLTDRWMGGALVGFSSGNLYSPLGRYNRSYYSIDPFVRHYFPTKGAWQAFAEARFNFTQISNQSVQGDTVPQFTEDGNYYSAEAGVGFDYFIAPNIAVEAGLKYRFLHGGSYDGSSYDRDLIQFDLGVKTFLRQRNDPDFNLQERYLHKGNYMLSGYGFAQPGSPSGFPISDTDQQAKGIHVGLSPSLSIFVQDDLQVSSTIHWTGNFYGTQKTINSGVSAKVAFYQPMGERLYFVPELSVEFGHQYYNGPDTKLILIDTLITNQGPLPLFIFDTTTISTHAFNPGVGFEPQLRYFTQGNTIWETGVGVWANWQLNPPGSSDRRVLYVRPYIGLEHFFAKNLSITARASFNLQNNAPILSGRNGASYDYKTTNLSFSVNYFIFQ